MNSYKLLLTSVENILRPQSFIKKGNTFYFFKDENWGLINFQKSKSNAGKAISFTINIGVSSTLLRKTIDHVNIMVKPEIEDCHWRNRIGFLLPKKQDYWWQLDNSTSLKNLIEEIGDVLNTLAIPEIKSHIGDESLEKLWLSGISEGSTELQRYVYLTTLLKLNNKEQLPLIIEELKSFSKGKSFEYTANEHIKKLESYG